VRGAGTEDFTWEKCPPLSLKWKQENYCGDEKRISRSDLLFFESGSRKKKEKDHQLSDVKAGEGIQHRRPTRDIVIQLHPDPPDSTRPAGKGAAER